MSERADFKTTPLFRLTKTYEDDLDKLQNPELEAKLSEQLHARLSEATERRDQQVRALFVIDLLLAIAVSGKNFTIPGTEINTTDLPAVLEVLTTLATYSFFITAASFTTWLCYSQLLWTIMQRSARDADIEGGILHDADHFNEMSLRLFQDKVAFCGDELFSPKWGFRALVGFYNAIMRVVFGMLPLMHLLLVGYSLLILIQEHWFGLLHTPLYVLIILGHLLGMIIYFAPSVQFMFRMRLIPYTRNDRSAPPP